MSPIKISIITPVYNRADCLPRCIDSVLRQGFDNWEMIIVDDGSKDGSARIAEKYQQMDARIRVFCLARNKGTNAARNKAISESKGDYILILDSDDWLSENVLTEVIHTIEDCPHYRHYIFQADDLLDYYSHNTLLNIGGRVTLQFYDWLSQKVTGDFIHVIDRSIMCALPFDEETRILEGVNFMRFYKAGERQLYSPFVVTRRDRGRSDSVTPSAYLFNKEAMNRSLAANATWLSYFTKDCEDGGFDDILNAKRKVVAMLYVAMGKYSEYDKLMQTNKHIGNWKLGIIRKLHLGYLLRQVIFFSTRIKKRK